MSLDKYAKLLGSTMSKNDILNLADEFKNQDDGYWVLMDYALGKDAGQAFRASWILECLILSKREWLKPHVIDFLNRFPMQRNDSSLRHFYKILAGLTSKKQAADYHEVLKSFDWEKLIDIAFQDLLSEDIKVAVKSQILSFLGNLSTYHYWIKEQLLEVIDLLQERESVAFFAKAKMIRKQLKLLRNFGHEQHI